MSLLSRKRALVAPVPVTASFESARAVPPTDMWGWVGLSLAAKFAKRTDSTLIDEHNDGIMMVVYYLNGCAIAAESDEEKAYLLRLRAEVSDLIINPEDLAALDSDTSDSDASDSDADDGTSHNVHRPTQIDTTDTHG